MKNFIDFIGTTRFIGEGALQPSEVQKFIGNTVNDGFEAQGAINWQFTEDSFNAIILGFSAVNFNGGWRFPDTGIPQGANILSTIITLNQKKNPGETPVAKWYGVNEDNAAEFNNTSRYPSNAGLLKTSESSDFVTDQNEDYHLVYHDVTQITQAIVNRENFAGTLSYVTLNEPMSDGLILIEGLSTSGNPIPAKLTAMWTL